MGTNFESIIESASALAETTTTGWNNSAFEISVSSDISNIPLNLGEFDTSSLEINNLHEYMNSLGSNLNSLIDTSQYAEVIDAAASSSINFLNEKVQRIKDAWLKKDTITVGALIGEISPYTLNTEEALSALDSKFNNLVNYLLGTSGDSWIESLSDLGTQYLDSLISDPSLTSSISNLKAIQAYGNVLNSMSSILTSVQQVMKYVEPLLPYAEVMADLAAAWVTGGASASKAGSKMTEITQQACQRLGVIALRNFKKVLFNIEVSLPSLLTGSLKSLSVREAVLTKNSNKWIENIFSEDFYQETMNNLTWQKAIDKTLDNYQGKIYDWSNFDFGDNSESNSSRGTYLKKKFLSKLVQNYMYGENGAIAKARSAAHLPSIDSLNDSYMSFESSIQSTIENNFNDNKSSLDKILSNDLDGNPIHDEISVMQISKKIYEYI